MDLLLNHRVTVGCFPLGFLNGEASIARVVAFVEDRHYVRLKARKEQLPRTKWGDPMGCKGLHPAGTRLAAAGTRRSDR